MATLHAVDYIIFILSIVFSFLIGVYYSCRKTTNTTEAYLLANRKLSIIPISISLLVSFFSAISMLGNSSEMYYYGAEYMLTVIGWDIGAFMATLTYVPLMQPLKLVSVHEYFQMRYNQRGIVYLGCFIQCLTSCFVNGVVLYGPAIMMESMIGIPVWASIVVIGVVATIYTTIGGFRAVIWSDVFQAVIIVIGLLVINIVLFVLVQFTLYKDEKGTIKANGPYGVWHTYYEQDRLNLRLTPSPFERSTVWAFLLGPIPMKMSLYAINQAAVQRYSSLPSLRAAIKSVLIAVPGHMVMIGLTCTSGVVAFSYFTQQGCDPLKNGDIMNSNQIIPYFVVEVLNYPAIPGIFIACIFCGSFSSYNGIAAMVWQDVLKDALKGKELTEFQKSLVTKFISFVAGVLSIIFAFISTQLRGTLIQLTMSFISGVTMPLLIILCLGALTPRSSWKSAVVSGLISGGFVMYLAVGTALSSQKKIILPTVTTNCSSMSQSHMYNSTMNMVMGPTTSEFEIKEDESDDIFVLYKLSFMWYTTIGYIIGLTIGITLTFIPGLRNEEDVDPKLIFPFMRKFWTKKGYLKYTPEKNGIYVPEKIREDVEKESDIKVPI